MVGSLPGRAPRAATLRPRADERDELPASHSRPQGSKPRTASSHSRLGPGMGQRGCELRPIVLVWECRLWIPRPGQNRKSSESANAFRFAPDIGHPICASTGYELPLDRLREAPSWSRPAAGRDARRGSSRLGRASAEFPCRRCRHTNARSSGRPTGISRRAGLDNWGHLSCKSA